VGEKRNACGILVLKAEGKRQHGRPGRKWENNVKEYQLNRIGRIELN
jgi:hypothetical protein